MMTPLQNLDERLSAWLGQLGLATDPPDAPPVEDEGAVRTFAHGDVVVMVRAFAQDGGTWLRIAALVRTDLAPSLELLHRLLQRNNEVLLGRFLLFEDNTLVFSETLHGDAVTPDAFERTLRYVAHVADTFTDELGPCGGGTPGAATLSMEDTPPCG